MCARVVDGTEIELVVADHGRRVAERVVRVDDDGAFAQVRFDAGLIGVAGIDEHDGAAIGRTRGMQVVEVAAEQLEVTVPVAAEDVAVQIRGADDRERDRRADSRHATKAANATPAKAASPSTQHCRTSHGSAL